MHSTLFRTIKPCLSFYEENILKYIFEEKRKNTLPKSVVLNHLEAKASVSSGQSKSQEIATNLSNIRQHRPIN